MTPLQLAVVLGLGGWREELLLDFGADIEGRVMSLADMAARAWRRTGRHGLAARLRRGSAPLMGGGAADPDSPSWCSA